MWCVCARMCTGACVNFDPRLVQESLSVKLGRREKIERNDAALLNEQWVVTMQSSMNARMAEQTSEQLVEERAAVRTHSQYEHLSQLQGA